MSLKWNGNQVLEEVKLGCVDALNEFGLRLELPSKRSLQYERGFLTGTYRRSLHADSPNFSFQSDDVKPSDSSPERGGKTGARITGKYTISIVYGSGLRYAIFVERRYGTIRQAHNQEWPRLGKLIEKHTRNRLK